MAVTIGQLAAALRITDGTDPIDPELTILTRLAAVADAFNELLAPKAPEVIRDEAKIRFCAYLFDAPTAGRGDFYGNGWRNSGAAGLVSRWQERRAGIQGESTAPGGATVDEAEVLAIIEKYNRDNNIEPLPTGVTSSVVQLVGYLIRVGTSWQQPTFIANQSVDVSKSWVSAIFIGGGSSGQGDFYTVEISQNDLDDASNAVHLSDADFAGNNGGYDLPTGSNHHINMGVHGGRLYYRQDGAGSRTEEIFIYQALQVSGGKGPTGDKGPDGDPGDKGPTGDKGPAGDAPEGAVTLSDTNPRPVAEAAASGSGSAASREDHVHPNDPGLALIFTETDAAIAGLHAVTRDLHRGAESTALTKNTKVADAAIVTANTGINGATAAWAAQVPMPGGGWNLQFKIFVRLKAGSDRSQYRLRFVPTDNTDPFDVPGGQWTPASATQVTNQADGFDYYLAEDGGVIGDGVARLEVWTSDHPTTFEGDLGDGIVDLDALTDAVVARLLPALAGATAGQVLQVNSAANGVEYADAPAAPAAAAQTFRGTVGSAKVDTGIDVPVSPVHHDNDLLMVASNVDFGGVYGLRALLANNLTIGGTVYDFNTERIDSTDDANLTVAKVSGSDKYLIITYLAV